MDGERDGQTEMDRETDGQRNGRTERRTDDRRMETEGERRTDRDMSERRRRISLAPKHSLKFSTDCVKHYTALQAERRSRGQRDGGGGELIDRRLSSVTMTGALLMYVI